MKSSTRAFAIDAALVTLFIIIGTRNHDTDENAVGVASTAAPFLVALVVGWLASRAWRSPLAVRTGITVWVVTIVVGMLLRHFAWDRGTAGAFIVVATVFNAFTLVGWRVVRENIASRRTE